MRRWQNEPGRRPAWRGAGAAFVLAAALGLAAACAPAGADEEGAVREAVREAIRSEGDALRIAVPGSEAPRSLRFDHVHDSVHETEGGRRVVCVDFESTEGTVHDLDYYVDREDGAWRVEDVVLHKVGEREVLAQSERERLDAKE